jgi:hypothetical protein
MLAPPISLVIHINNKLICDILNSFIIDKFFIEIYIIFKTLKIKYIISSITNLNRGIVSPFKD